MSRKGKKKPADRESRDGIATRKVDSPSDQFISVRDCLFAIALTAAVFLAYQPAWHGGFLWDDNEYLMRPALQGLQGLARGWYDFDATQQYFPLLHTAFWVQHQLFGDWTTGYHLVTIALHCLTAILFWQILRRLDIPGSYLAATIFALHPVHVESVAWIEELKNTLSGVWYMGTALAYLKFDRTRAMRWYALAIALFVLAVLSKTTTATLPPALLVIFWWKRGRLSWKSDVLPILPLFLIGAGAGIFTAWIEIHVAGAGGGEFDLPLLERCLLAGRTACFYLGKLLWPANLMFMYPRWQISRAVAWQYLPLLAVMATLAVLWLLRHRTRAPLAAALFFLGTLVPVAGFFNIYVYRYSYVTDHFQYLPSLGVITIFSAGVAMLLKRGELWQRVAGWMACVTLVAWLAVLTWCQCWMYTDIVTLYRTTLAANPNCVLAYTNLGDLLANGGQIDDAIAVYREGVQANPDDAGLHFNLGLTLTSRGNADDADEAIYNYRRAVDINADYVNAHNNLGVALAGRGEYGEAIGHYRKALEFSPGDPEIHHNLGIALANDDQFAKAIDQFGQAIAIKPDYAEAYFNLGNALARRGDRNKAMEPYQKALVLADAQGNKALADAIRASIRSLSSGGPKGRVP